MKYIIFIVIAIIIIWAAAVYKPGQSTQVPVATNTINATSTPNITTMPNGLKIEDVKVGTGAEAKKGSLITVHYVGTLDNGTKFDSSRDRGEPFQFPLGQGMVIQGWEQGFEGMKVGGIRKLTIPPELGYGATGAGAAIPPNATLHFEVELLGVREN